MFPFQSISPFGQPGQFAQGACGLGAGFQQPGVFGQNPFISNPYIASQFGQQSQQSFLSPQVHQAIALHALTVCQHAIPALEQLQQLLLTHLQSSGQGQWQQGLGQQFSPFQSQSQTPFPYLAFQQPFAPQSVMMGSQQHVSPQLQSGHVFH